MKNLKIYYFGILTSFVVAQSCAPVFSDLQSARMAGAKEMELTPHFSTTSVSEEGETERVQNHIGLQLAYGVSDKVDLRFRYENVWAEGSGLIDGISILGFGPKLSLVKDKVSLYTPIGTAIGEGVTDAWEFQPTLLFTLPIIDQRLDLTVAPKYVVQFCDDCDHYFAFNTGLGFGGDLSRWAIRPEFGLLFAEGASASHISIGVSFKVTKPK